MDLKFILRYFCLLLMLPLCISGSLVHAQANTGVIRGTVSDPTGAVIPGATVNITTS